MPPKNTPAPEQPIPPALLVFSKTRDLDSSSPYHLDGDMQMYEDLQLQARAVLAQDPDILKEINTIVGMYQLQQGQILEAQYKRMQRKMALALRPDMDEEELEFIVDEDWRLDSQSRGGIAPEEMVGKIFELVDVWTIGVDKQEYLTFVRLLTKKIGRK